MTKQDDIMIWLQQWYHSNCDGDWEHNQNVIITTIDNPGWTVTINLEGTNLENHQFIETSSEISDLNWIYCRIKENQFRGAGGPHNLLDIVQVFRKWVEEEGCE